jgi:hypothetical protein
MARSSARTGIDDQEFYQLLDRGGVTDDIHLFNEKLREWEDYYNYHRPHGTLDFVIGSPCRSSLCSRKFDETETLLTLRPCGRIERAPEGLGNDTTVSTAPTAIILQALAQRREQEMSPL